MRWAPPTGRSCWRTRRCSPTPTAQTKAEEKVLAKLVEKLGIADAEAKQIVATARERAQKLAQRV